MLQTHKKMPNKIDTLVGSIKAISCVHLQHTMIGVLKSSPIFSSYKMLILDKNW
jgi:hypothetical protein